MKFEISNPPLRISLIVPVRDEEGSLARLVSSIRAQTRQPDEIILVDGGSTDRTVELARELDRAVGRAPVDEDDLVGLSRLRADGGDEPRERPLLVSDGDDE